MKAVVVSGINEFQVEEVELAPPGDFEIKVSVKAAGICATDLSAIKGTMPTPFPFVLGHEGSGIVTEVGSKVTKTRVGDHVVFTLQPVCGRCESCAKGEGVNCETTSPEQMMSGALPGGSYPFSRPDGTQLGSFLALGCIAEETVVHEDYAVKIDNDISFDAACLTSCGVLTGAGGAIYGGDISVGSSVVVIGCGAVGLAAVQGARIAGAGEIIAVDIVDSKLAMAKEFGATHVVNSSDGKMMENVRSIINKVDVVFECTGIAPLVTQGFELLKDCGTIMVIGVPPMDQMVQIPIMMIPFTGRIIKGGKYGCHHPHLDIPALLKLFKQGKLDLNSMITKIYDISQFEAAALDASTNTKGVIAF